MEQIITKRSRLHSVDNLAEHCMDSVQETRIPGNN